MTSDIQAAAQAILDWIGPDPNAAQHFQALAEALSRGCRITDCTRQHRRGGLCDAHSKAHQRLMANEAFTINRKAA